jgi:hypothetical protein
MVRVSTTLIAHRGAYVRHPAQEISRSACRSVLARKAERECVSVSLVHGAAMIAAGGAFAWSVYQYFGLKFVSRSWFNLDARPDYERTMSLVTELVTKKGDRVGDGRIRALVANRPKSRTDPYACFCGHRDRTAKHGSLSSGSKRATGRALRPDSLRLLSTPCSASLTMLDGEVGSTRVAMALRLSLRLPDVILSREQKLLRRWALEQPPA